jgi:hypothetical protein
VADYQAIAGSTSQVVDLYTGFSGPTSWSSSPAFGSGTSVGSAFSIYGLGGDLFLPHGYVSGSQLNNVATFSNETIEDLGLIPGSTFTYTFGNGADADSVVFEVAAVPEPSTWAMMILGFAGIGFAAYRKRKGAALAV